jgi:hypothetical protein
VIVWQRHRFTRDKKRNEKLLMTTDKLTGLAFITAMLLCFCISMADNAEAKQVKPIKTKIHLVCHPAPCRK